jgi:hypothetical protein
MSIRIGNIAFPFMSAPLLVLTLAGCESTGSYRVASVGAQGPQGIQGPQGAEGPGGAQGSGGAGGLDGTNAIASGGLVGPGGAAGTGLLANTGNPSKTTPGVAGVLVASGSAASRMAGQGTPLAERADGTMPGGLTITGRVIRTADNGGQALVRAGDGRDYLVDGLAASPGQLVTVNVQDRRVLGANGDRPLVGATAAAATVAQPGDLATLGAGNNDRPVTVGTPATGAVPGLVNGQPAANGAVTNTVNRVTQPLSGLRRGN